MTRRLTRLAVEVIAAAPPTVTPRAVLPDPPVIVPPNWIEAVQLATTWSTSVAAAADVQTEDRRILLSRPVRTITLLLSGWGAMNSSALIAMLQRYAAQEAPLPLYCDQSFLTTAAAPTDTTVYCDTRWRRFFRGQRIALYDTNWRDLNDSVGEHAIIEDIFVDRLVLTAGIVQSYRRGSRVYPMIDVEELTESSIDLLTNNKSDARVTFLELSGPSALPSLWTPGRFAAALGPTYLGKPVLEQRPNWIQAPSLTVTRDIARFQSGKAAMRDVPTARPRMRFGGSYDALHREDVWGTLRFFDSRAGRGLSWWIPALADAWQIIDMTTTDVTVRGGGRLADAQMMVEHVAVMNGMRWVTARGVASIAAAGDAQTWTITFDSPLEGIPAIPNVRPLHLVRFSDDTITETWTNLNVCSAQLRAEEIVEDNDVGVANLPATIVAAQAPAAIPGLQWWFDGTRNLYLLDTRLGPGVTVRTTPWPAVHFLASEWMDVRAALPNIVRQADLPRHRLHNDYAAPAFIVPYQHPERNGGHPAHLIQSSWRLASLGGGLPVADQEAWDNGAGCTIVIVLIGGASPPPYTVSNAPQVFWQESAGAQLTFSWRLAASSVNAELQLYATPGVSDPNLLITHPSILTTRPQMIAFRWAPGGKGQVIMSPLGATPPTIYETAATLASFPSVVGYLANSSWFTAFAMGAPISSQVADDLYREHPQLIAFLAFKRALLDSELNTIMAYYARSHGIESTPLP